MLELPFDRIPLLALFCRSDTSDESELLEPNPKLRNAEGIGAADGAGNCDC